VGDDIYRFAVAFGFDVGVATRHDAGTMCARNGVAEIAPTGHGIAERRSLLHWRTPTNMIQVENLQKRFGGFTAVESISFEAQAGEVFGLLGPNGAGKSTTINCICGLLTPTSGRVTVNGYDVVRDGSKARGSLGVAPQELALYEDLSATENLSYWGGAQGLRGRALAERIRDVLDLVGLADRAKEPVKNYSGGMKRRLNYAAAIVHKPEVVLLDEPTVGVDPQSRVRLLELVRQQADEGACVLYTTHYMEEAESLCNRLAIVDHGKVIALGSHDELRAMTGERDLLRLAGTFDETTVLPALAVFDGLEIVQATGDLLTLSLREASNHLPAVFAALNSVGAEVKETTLSRPSLESLFMKLTGKELRE
jgi:ABC-2 type transport system ATP-binding protein